jgi:acyl carrier protein
MEFEKIRDIISEQLDIASDRITMETHFEKDLKADSLDLFQVIMALEEAFGLEFSVEASKSVKTVGDAVKYIKENGK